MNESNDRWWELFFELFNSLPRQGPGNRASAVRALDLCRELGPRPTVLDIGCGSGAQTMYLAELTDGQIVALDSNEAGIDVLRRRIVDHGFTDRVHAKVADMLDPGESDASFDLVWSEGALYSTGLERSLPVCRRLLREGGYLVFTDAVWLRGDPPDEVRTTFEWDYPTMGSVDSVKELLKAHGFDVLSHFPLPDSAWWEDFYTPMENEIARMRESYAGDRTALQILDEMATEPEMHRKYSDYYGYEFFIARR